MSAYSRLAFAGLKIKTLKSFIFASCSVPISSSSTNAVPCNPHWSACLICTLNLSMFDLTQVLDFTAKFWRKEKCSRSCDIIIISLQKYVDKHSDSLNITMRYHADIERILVQYPRDPFQLLAWGEWLYEYLHSMHTMKKLVTLATSHNAMQMSCWSTRYIADLVPIHKISNVSCWQQIYQMHTILVLV